MNEYLKEGLIVLIVVPIAYIFLRLIFKKSIMFTFSFYIVIFILYVSFIKFIEIKLGGLNAIWTVASNIIIGVIIFSYINKILRKPLENAINQVKSVSEGNLDINIEKKNTQNELGILNNSLADLIKNLHNIITEIEDNANSLSSASQQISNASQQLAQGANEQASSVEEISSTMEEMTANISSNTGNAQQTEKMSIEANKGIIEVAAKSKNAVEGNKTIVEKITIINDIAFQTNILALNAAVEAARAGEHGKGFAVVAAEVRKLAERSKVAAEEIVSLTQNIYDQSNSAGEVISSTLPKVENTTKLIQEIAASSVEQNNGASQVNSAIQQLNNVTQQNASSAEELSSNAEELSAQADRLKELISFFTINNTQKSGKNSTRSVAKSVNKSNKENNAIVKTSKTDKDFETF